MINFDIMNIPDIIFGRDTEKRAGELMKEFGAAKVLIHHSGEPFVLPLVERIGGYLTEAGLEWVELGGVVPNPRLSKVYEGIELCRREHIDGVLAVGGGSVIDCCKIVSAQARTQEDIWNMETVGKRYPTEFIPMGAVVTASGTGSEMNNGAVITNEEQKIKGGILGTHASFAVLNPDYTMTVPFGNVK